MVLEEQREDSCLWVCISENQWYNFDGQYIFLALDECKNCICRLPAPMLFTSLGPYCPGLLHPCTWINDSGHTRTIHPPCRCWHPAVLEFWKWRLHQCLCTPIVLKFQNVYGNDLVSARDFLACCTCAYGLMSRCHPWLTILELCNGACVNSHVPSLFQSSNMYSTWFSFSLMCLPDPLLWTWNKSFYFCIKAWQACRWV